MSKVINSSTEITIQLDSDVVKAYNSATLTEKKKIKILLSAWLKDAGGRDRSSLKRLMDEISDAASARGLTPEILDDILSERKD